MPSRQRNAWPAAIVTLWFMLPPSADEWSVTFPLILSEPGEVGGRLTLTIVTSFIPLLMVWPPGL